jgi:uncharacterized protein (DUF2147 family)
MPDGIGPQKQAQCADLVGVLGSMKKLSLLSLFLSLASALAVGQALAGEPSGDWRVEDGTAHIRIAICAGNLWGVIGWEQKPGVDSENPDPAKKSRPTLGMPILLEMKPVEANKWAGQIYNAKNGKMYQASVTALSDTSLKVQGCVLGGLFCGGETWVRVGPVPAAAPAPGPAGTGKTTGAANVVISDNASNLPMLDVPGWLDSHRLPNAVAVVSALKNTARVRLDCSRSVCPPRQAMM